MAVLTAAGCRAARALLKWSVRDLMRNAGVSPNTVTRIEGGGEVLADTADRIIAAFDAAGVELLNSGRAGARFKADCKCSKE